MKKRILILTAAMLTLVAAFAQQKEAGVVKLRGTRLTYPLVNRWIAEFNKEHPGIKVSIAPNAPADSIDFTIASYALTEKELEGGKEGIAVTRYAQLLVANSQRPDLAALQAKGFTEKSLSDLFFKPNTPSFLTASSNTPVALYVRDRPTCAVKAFADHYDGDAKSIRGTGVKGDDQDLAEAVRKDVNGISFNNLGFIYDVKTRKITPGLAIIPQDLNENGKIDADEQIYNTLDNVIAKIEKTNNPKFIAERVNFIFNKKTTNAAAGIFLNWVLNKGQQFSRDLGFLSLDAKLLTDEKAIVESSFKVSSVSSCEGADKLMSIRREKIAAK